MNRPRRARRRRRGYAIVEILLVISCVVIMCGLCAGLIHSLLRLDRAARDHQAEGASRDRLARQFRRDVHAASRSSLTPGPGAERLELVGPGGRVVTYRAGEGGVVRDERDGDRPVRREEYRLPSHALTRFRALEDEGSPLVVLSLRRKEGTAPASLQREADYEALLGREARLAKRPGGGS